MAVGLSGSQALKRVDGAIVELRRMLSDAISSADKVAAREAEVRSVQVQVYRDLAGVRLEVLDELDPGDLDRLHLSALELLKEHEKYVAWEQSELKDAAAKIAALETRRTQLAKDHGVAVEAYEAEVARVETSLKTEARYKALAQQSETLAAIAARAHQKLEVARADLATKGAPYTSDKLFAYLWSRKFRTPDYRAGLITRMLDGWVASLCKYDQAWMNYQRLSQLPDWLTEHASEQDKKAAAALAALEDAEHDALEASGANQLKAAADKALESVRAVDREIDQAEAAHQAIAARHASALNANEGPAKEARRILEEGLKRASFQDLRTLAAETIAMDDDRLVDRLVKLRTEEMQLELESQKLATVPDRLRHDLAEVEELRRQFKQARYDSDYAVFSSASIDETLASVVQGRSGAGDAMRFLSQAVRRIEPRAEPGFGGSRRSETLGLPDVLGEILWEVAKEAGRGGSRGGSIDFPSPSRRSPRINFPSGGGGRSGGGGGGGRRGGFRTGGGF